MADENRWREENRWRGEDDRRRYEEGRGDWGRQGRGPAGGASAGWREGGVEQPQGGGMGRGYGREDDGQAGYGGGGTWAGRGQGSTGYGQSGGYGEGAMGGGYGQGGMGRGYGQGGRGERGMWDRAADEVSSWFGDEDAERRRRMDEARGGEHRGRGPKGYARSDDRIREDVCDRLSDDPSVDASEIEVGVSNCEVTLSGTVSSRDQRRRAEDCVERVSGVKHVQNNIRVQQTGAEGMTAGTTVAGSGAQGSTGGTRSRS